MTTPIQITGTVKAWTTSIWQNMDHVLHLVKEGKPDEAAAAMMYVDHDMSDSEGWAEVGTATITVTFHPREEVVAKELEGLNAQLQKVRADNAMRENAILDRISKLQALEYTA